MHGRRSLDVSLFSYVNSIDRIGRRTRSPENSEKSESESEPESESESVNMENLPRPMKDYARPTIGTSPSCIVLSNAARNYELKHIHF